MMNKLIIMLRNEFEKTIVPIKHANGTVQTGMTMYDVVMCVHACVCIFAVKTRNDGMDSIKAMVRK